MTSILAQAKVGQKRHRSGGGGGALAVAVVLVPPPVPPMLTLCFVCVARLGLCCLARLALLRLHQGWVTDLLARAERSWPRAKMGGAAALALLSWRRGTAADALARTAHSQLKWGGGAVALALLGLRWGRATQFGGRRGPIRWYYSYVSLCRVCVISPNNSPLKQVGRRRWRPLTNNSARLHILRMGDE